VAAEGYAKVVTRSKVFRWTAREGTHVSPGFARRENSYKSLMIVITP
jgi:hypothetical protein